MALINTYYIDDIGHHPLLPDNHEARLLQVIIELECEDAADRCQTAIASHQSMITSNHNFFLHIKAVWTGIGALWDDLKTFHKQIKKLHIITDTFTKWLPPFLYSNNTVHVNITNGKEIKYKQIRRYTLVESKAYGFWDLYLIQNLVLPCDRLHGPFISNNTQIFQCQTLLNMIRKEQSDWDETMSVMQNFQQNPDWIYWYNELLPFYNLWWNQYDRKLYFAANSEQTGRRNLAARDDKKTTNKLMSRKEFRWAKKFQSMENKLEIANKEIERKEHVIQYMSTNYQQLQQRFATLQAQHQQTVLQLQAHQQQQQYQYQPVPGYYYNPQQQY